MDKVKVVIVDDSSFSITLLNDILTEKGFDVVGHASFVEEIIEVIKEKKPDLVTMDMTMPGTDGFECTKVVHSIDPNIKVIVVSSLMDDELIKKAKQTRISGYVQKPVDPDEIEKAINRVMSSNELLIELQNSYFDIFKESFADNLNRATKTTASYLNESQSKGEDSSRGVAIVIGIIGKYSGRMILDLSHETASAMAASVLKREPRGIEETLAFIEEFSNIIAGNACSVLNRKNKLFGFKIAPPTAFYGESINIARGELNAKSIVAQTNFGEMCLNVGFKRGEEEWM